MRIRLIIAHASWLALEDFADFIHAGASTSDPAAEVASIGKTQRDLRKRLTIHSYHL